MKKELIIGALDILKKSIEEAESTRTVLEQIAALKNVVENMDSEDPTVTFPCKLKDTYGNSSVNLTQAFTAFSTGFTLALKSKEVTAMAQVVGIERMLDLPFYQKLKVEAFKVFINGQIKDASMFYALSASLELSNDELKFTEL